MNLMTIMWRSVHVLMGLGIPVAGKALDVITKFSHSKICQKKKSKYDAHQMTTLQYLTWCTDHESKCLMNHEGSASVSDIFKYIHTIFISTQMHVLLFRSQILNALVSHCSIWVFHFLYLIYWLRITKSNFLLLCLLVLIFWICPYNIFQQYSKYF